MDWTDKASVISLCKSINSNITDGKLLNIVIKIDNYSAYTIICMAQLFDFDCRIELVYPNKEIEKYYQINSILEFITPIGLK